MPDHVRAAVRAALYLLAFGAFAAVTSAQSPAPEEQSCRAFVQNFYDSYWNRYSAHVDERNFKFPGLDSILRKKPPVLSPELIELIQKDEKESKASGEVGRLDFDPFLNSQDPQGKYVVAKVEVGAGTCKATVSRAHIVAELKQAGSSWIFVNFRYSYYNAAGKKDAPDGDLLQILRE